MVQRRLIPLTTQQLEYLTAVADHETWSEAADEVGVSPSALSQGLAELERRIGISLFERSGRNRVLTPSGRHVVDRARRILTEVADLTHWTEATRSGRGGLVRLGLIDVSAVHHYPTALRRFRTERPEVDFRLTVAPSGSLLTSVLNGDLDLAVIVEPGLIPGGVDSTTAYSEDLAVYAPPSGIEPAVADEPSRWGPWVTFPAQSHTRRLIAAALRRAGAEFRVEAESNQPEVLREMTHLGMGWTVLPVVQGELVPNPLHRVRPEPLTSRTLLLVRRSGLPSTPAVDALADLLLSTPVPAPSPAPASGAKPIVD